MYPLLESIRIEQGAPERVQWHQARMERSYRALFGRDCPFDLAQIMNAPRYPQEGVFKARFLYGVADYTLEYAPYTPKVIHTLQVVQADGLAYAHKYADRQALEQLYLQRGVCDDVLIIQGGQVTDTSFCNILFHDGVRWYTPASPLLSGTQRAYLVARGVVEERVITLADLSKMCTFKLINAMITMEQAPRRTIENIMI